MVVRNIAQRGHKYSLEDEIELLKQKIKENEEKYRAYEISPNKTNLEKGRPLEATIESWKYEIEKLERKKKNLPTGEYGSSGYY